MLPVYNPLVFKELVKILKWICVFCHHFKMNEDQVNFELELQIKKKMLGYHKSAA